MTEWTIDDVAARFAEAAETGRRLPRVRVQGYFNVWPEFKREPWEVIGSAEEGYRPLPPTPEAVDRMLEAMRWMQWLEVDERHLVWMRAKHYEWKLICRRLGRDRTTAWRRWQKALQRVADHLNGRQTAASGHASKLEGQVG
jgi:flavin-binding protein dodecin